MRRIIRRRTWQRNASDLGLPFLFLCSVSYTLFPSFRGNTISIDAAYESKQISLFDRRGWQTFLINTGGVVRLKGITKDSPFIVRTRNAPAFRTRSFTIRFLSLAMPVLMRMAAVLSDFFVVFFRDSFFR